MNSSNGNSSIWFGSNGKCYWCLLEFSYDKSCITVITSAKILA